jgi:hypothetical protein
MLENDIIFENVYSHNLFMGFFDMLLGLFRVPLSRDFSDTAADESRSTVGPVTERASLVLQHRTSAGGLWTGFPVASLSACAAPRISAPG